jgi:hypothetical protein
LLFPSPSPFNIAISAFAKVPPMADKSKNAPTDVGKPAQILFITLLLMLD